MRQLAKTTAPLKASLAPEKRLSMRGSLSDPVRPFDVSPSVPFASGSSSSPSRLDRGDTQPPSTSGFGHDFSKILIFPPSQPQISEADISSFPSPSSSIGPSQMQHSSPPALSHDLNQLEVPTAPFPAQEVLHTPGHPLDADTRVFMEPRFGQDFSRVRIHADEGAATAARTINATAYTIGQDIVFDSGHYRPETNMGKRLLAHELAHVVQQSRGGTITPPPLLTHPLEQAAQHAASTIVQGGTAHVAGASAPGIARQPRSLNESLNPTSMSDADLQQEIALIRQWLDENPASSPEREQLTASLSTMEAEVMRRNGQQNQTPVGQNQIDTGAVTAVATPAVAAGMFTPGVSPLSPTTPPPGSIPEGAFNNFPRIPGETPFQAPTTQVPGAAAEAADTAVVEGAGEGATETVGTGLLEGLGATLAGIGAFLAVTLYSPSLNEGEDEMIKQDKARAQAAGQVQLPGQQGQNPTPVVDPTTGEPLYTPASGDYTPAIDPVTGEPLQAPGPANQSGEPMKATSHILPPVTTPAGRKLAEHALESLPRHGQMTPEQVDYVIDNPSRTTTQDDGATVYIKKEPGRGRSYSIVIVSADVVVTGMQNLTPIELANLGRNNGFNPNP